ncbi:MAG: PleD family two-component system response regulator [Promethearchaeota archaeon]
MQNVSQSVILIVDDNEDILFHLRFLLESNGYKVLTALNGKEALKIMSELEKLPDLIISDIMMPRMDGYEFFKALSNDPKSSRIPFLFLTAKSTPDDIRLGKMLGVDDYITKPFKKEDLMAIISGKIARYQKANLIDREFTQQLSSLQIEMQSSTPDKDQRNLYLLYVYWDDVMGPVINKYFPSDENFTISIDILGMQLFQAVTSIYGHDKITKAQGFLLNIENIDEKGYIYFDSYPEENERYGEKQYMLSVISSNLTYFNSLKIKQIMKEISEKIKDKQDWEIKEYWEKILDILSTDSLLYYIQ